MPASTEARNCQNCKAKFQIEPADLDFYEKIKVPPPTFCPECRAFRRLMFRNERTLYKRPCGLCGAEIISIYHKDNPHVVYCQPCWWSDEWSPLDNGRDYDFNRTFFEQYRELLHETPVPALGTFYTTLLNSDYANEVSNLKNCYLIFNSDYNENCAFGTEIEHSRDCYDNLMIDACSLSYDNVNCRKCYNTFYSIDCENSHDIWFSKDLSGCSDCFGCVGLRKKQYHIWNQPYSKEDYEKEIEKMELGSRRNVEKYREEFRKFALKFPRKYMHGRQNTNAVGDYIYHSKDIKNSFIVTEAQNCRYCQWLLVKPAKDCWDYMQFGDNAQNVYETMIAGNGIDNLRFGIFCVTNISRVTYGVQCRASSDLFGCVSLRSKKHCILNKQYSPGEYAELVPKIIEHMNSTPYTDKQGRVYKFGEFFPVELSSFAYNETTAIEYFPMTKEEALAKGLRWKEEEARSYAATKPAADLPDTIAGAGDDILQEVIACAHEGKCEDQCTTAFKIIPAELAFYRQLGIPLPRLCPNCRHHRRMLERNPIKLHDRRCACAGAASENDVYRNTVASHQPHAAGEHCPNEFQTTYAPDRPEIVYCEECYQAEVA